MKQYQLDIAKFKKNGGIYSPQQIADLHALKVKFDENKDTTNNINLLNK